MSEVFGKVCLGVEVLGVFVPWFCLNQDWPGFIGFTGGVGLDDSGCYSSCSCKLRFCILNRMFKILRMFRSPTFRSFGAGSSCLSFISFASCSTFCFLLESELT